MPSAVSVNASTSETRALHLTAANRIRNAVPHLAKGHRTTIAPCSSTRTPSARTPFSSKRHQQYRNHSRMRQKLRSPAPQHLATRKPTRLRRPMRLHRPPQQYQLSMHCLCSRLASPPPYRCCNSGLHCASAHLSPQRWRPSLTVVPQTHLCASQHYRTHGVKSSLISAPESQSRPRSQRVFRSRIS